jgi:RimJ/RimL family protein N-acetyltransferase
MPLSLSGARVRLRALETRDLDTLIEAYRDFDLQLTTDGDAPPMSDLQVRELWGGIISDPGPDLRYFAIEPLEGSAQMVGACSLQHIDMRNRNAELSIFMVSNQGRGQGYGTEAVNLLMDYAFEVVRVDRLHLGVYDFNEAGLRVYERVGFRYEGRHRNALYYDGRYQDEWTMSVLREDWLRYRQPPADGLRPYHPDDYLPALALLERLLPAPDREAARAALRRWWRLLGHTLYAYQADGALVGLLPLPAENAPPRGLIVEDKYRSLVEEAIRQSG